MSDLIKKSVDTVKSGLDSLKNIKKDKREYHEYLNRIKTLPDDYRYVFEKIQKYMWGFSGGGDGYDMIKLQSDLLEMFEESVIDGKQVLDITGEDVASFCDELLKDTKTYTQITRMSLNNDILNKVKNNNQTK
ncbi:MAG: DUF1048 domain-containing protein [Oscillospiraceae bacterium]